MGAVAERDVTGSVAADVQRLRALELGRVAVGRRQRHRDGIPFLDHLTIQFDVLKRRADDVILIDGEIPKDLLDRSLDLRWVGADRCQLIRMLQQSENTDG